MAGRPALTGTLHDLPLAELIDWVGTASPRGVVELSGGAVGTIVLVDGRIALASADDGPTLAQMVIGSGAISSEGWDAALAKAHEGRDLADTLLERGADEGGPVAIAALEALRGLGDPRALPIAARLLDAEAPELVRAAVACLGRVAEGRDLEVLIPLLGHPSWAVRAEVIRVLAERGVQRAAPALLRRLEQERDEFVREAMLRALERLES
jgi:hypothetical protein